MTLSIFDEREKLEKENVELKESLEKQKDINKDYVVECEELKKQLEDEEREYEALVDFMQEHAPVILQQYTIQKLKQKGAKVFIL